MPKILVTGGAGYIGSHVVDVLLSRGFDVQVIDDLSRGYRHNVQSERLHVCNLSDSAFLKEFLTREKFDAVVHFAAYIAVGESVQKPELYFANNIGATISLLDSMVHAKVNRLVFSSTAAVYGQPARIPIPEDTPIAPESPYGESKATVERLLGWFDRSLGFRSICLRYFNAAGADPQGSHGEEHDPETHLIPLLLRAAVTGKPVTIFGDDYSTPDGTCIRDYVHVLDLAEAHVLALESLLSGGSSNAFNVGTGFGNSVKEVLQAVEAVVGRPVPFQMGARREGDTAKLVADAGKLRRLLGWTPKYTQIRDIVQTAWDFERKHHSL